MQSARQFLCYVVNMFSGVVGPVGPVYPQVPGQPLPVQTLLAAPPPPPGEEPENVSTVESYMNTAASETYMNTTGQEQTTPMDVSSRFLVHSIECDHINSE